MTVSSVQSAILVRVFVLLILTVLTRKDRIWKSLQISDLYWIILLTVLTAGAGSLLPSGGVSADGTALFWLLLLIAVNSAAEELFFRVWVISVSVRAGLPLWLPVIFSTALFAYTHSWQGSSAVILAAFSGLLYSLCFIVRKRAFTVIAAHVLHNVLALLTAG